MARQSVVQILNPEGKHLIVVTAAGLPIFHCSCSGTNGALIRQDFAIGWCNTAAKHMLHAAELEFIKYAKS